MDAGISSSACDEPSQTLRVRVLELSGFSKSEEIQYVKGMMVKNDIENSKREACIMAKAEGKPEGATEKKPQGGKEDEGGRAGAFIDCQIFRSHG